MTTQLPPDMARDFLEALVRLGLLRAGERAPPVIPLAGGVSSDIVREDLPSGPVCVKRALPKLKVKADWQAPVERNRWEVEWMRTAAQVEPHAVPRILGEDAAAGMFALAFLDEDRSVPHGTEGSRPQVLGTSAAFADPRVIDLCR